MELERLVQTFDANTRPFDQRVAELNRNLREVDRQASLTSRAVNRNMTFAFQNVGFQIQDFVVQVGSGTSVLRAFTQQAPQLLGAFGPVGVWLGVAAGLVGGLASAFVNMGSDADDAAKDTEKLADALKLINDLSDTSIINIEKLAESYAEASAQARGFIRAQAEIASEAASATVNPARAEFGERIEALQRQIRAGVSGGDLSQEQALALRDLTTAFAETTIGADQFREELNKFIEQAGPRSAAALREYGDAAISAGAKVVDLAEASRELSAGVSRLGSPAAPAAATASGAAPSGRTTDPRRLAFAFGPPTPEVFGPPAPGTPGAAVLEEMARGREMIAQQAQMAENYRQLTVAANRFTDSLAAGLTDAIFEAQTLNDALRGVLLSTSRMAVQTGLQTGLSAGFGALFGLPATRQFGGIAQAGMPTLVHKDEIIVPDVNSQVISAFDQRSTGRSAERGPSSASGPVVVMNIVTPDARSFGAMQPQLLADATRMIGKNKARHTGMGAF